MGRKILFVVLFLVFINSAYALEYYPVNLILKNANTGYSMNNLTSEVIAVNESGKEIRFLQFVNSGEQKIFLPNGNWKVDVLLDDSNTPGIDYHGYANIIIQSSNATETVYFYPIGSLSGIVLDKLENIVPDANLRFECTNSHNEVYPDITDDFGSFSMDWVSVGKCRISAMYGKGFGSAEINITQGSSNAVEIKLDKTILENKSNDSYLFLAIIILIFIVLVIAFLVYYFIRRMRKMEKKEKRISKAEKKAQKELKKEKKEIKHEEKEIKELEKKINERMQDIMKTLNNKEKEVVNCILEHNNETTQAKVYYKTGIPKTSLSRVLQSLESKNIIATEKIGKMKKLKLTAWFLGE